jgi:hypothetical protein
MSRKRHAVHAEARSGYSRVRVVQSFWSYRRKKYPRDHFVDEREIALSERVRKKNS